MERISIFNYEAFYLDFLEGNLSEEDTSLLLQFLEEHPELKVDDDSLLVVENELPELDAQFKSDLKFIAFDQEVITKLNVEQFLIAETEGLLSAEKQNELNKFVSDDASLVQLQKIYSSAHLVADSSIVYPDKNSLKQNKRIVLWPYIAAAAASVALFFFLWNPSSQVNKKGSESVISHVKPKQIKEQNTVKPVEQENKNIDQTEKSIEQVVPVNPNDQTNPIDIAVVEPRNQRPYSPEIKGIKLKKAGLVNGTNHSPEIVENNTIAKTNAVPKKESDYDILAFNDMNNPIAPITNRIENAMNQDVDFRSAKATENRSGGFYLKLGKLEISRRQF